MDHGWSSKLFDTVHEKCAVILLAKNGRIVMIMITLSLHLFQQKSLNGYLFMEAAMS